MIGYSVYDTDCSAVSTGNFNTFLCTSQSISATNSPYSLYHIPTSYELNSVFNDFSLDLDKFIYDEFQLLIVVDRKQDRTKFSELRKHVWNKVLGRLEYFVNMGYIEDFNIINVYSEYLTVKVIFNIFIKGKIKTYTKEYLYNSSNYGLR